MVGVLAFCFLAGAWRGLVYEVFALAAWVVAFFAAQTFADAAAAHLPLGDLSPGVRYAIGFLVLFVAAMCLTTLMGSLLTRLLSAVGLGLLNRFFGAWFGLARGGVLLLAVTAVVEAMPMHTSTSWQASQGAIWLRVGLHALQPWLPQQIGQYL
jgi:membrane protein required for colicin V production